MKHLAMMSLLVVLKFGTASPGDTDDSRPGVPPCVEFGASDTAKSADNSTPHLCHPIEIVHMNDVSPQSSSPPHTNVRTDPHHPLKLGRAYYPKESKRAQEEGRCIVRMTVTADGRITAASLDTSSGYSRLDQACLNAVKGQRMLPATEKGSPIEQTLSLPITWKLTNKG